MVELLSYLSYDDELADMFGSERGTKLLVDSMRKVSHSKELFENEKNYNWIIGLLNLLNFEVF